MMRLVLTNSEADIVSEVSSETRVLDLADGTIELVPKNWRMLSYTDLELQYSCFTRDQGQLV